MLNESQSTLFFEAECNNTVKFITSLMNNQPCSQVVNILVVGGPSSGKTSTIRSMIRAFRKHNGDSSKIYGQRQSGLVKYTLQPGKCRNYIIEGYQWSTARREIVFYELNNSQKAYFEEVRKTLTQSAKIQGCLKIPGLSLAFQGLIICSNLVQQGGLEPKLVSLASKIGLPYWLVMTNLTQFQNEFHNEYEYLTCLQNIIRGIFCGSTKDMNNDGYYCIENVSLQAQTLQTRYYALNLLKIIMKQTCNEPISKVKPACWGYFC